MRRIAILLSAALFYFSSLAISGQSLAEEWYSNRSYHCGELVGQYNDSLLYDLQIKKHGFYEVFR